MGSFGLVMFLTLKRGQFLSKIIAFLPFFATYGKEQPTHSDILALSNRF